MIRNPLIILNLIAIVIFAVNSSPQDAHSLSVYHDSTNPNSLFNLLLNAKKSQNQTEFLNQVRDGVNNILAVVSPQGTVYLWDLLLPELRVTFLKRVNYRLSVNQSLSWSSLPEDTQTKLLNLNFDFSSNSALRNISSELNTLLSSVEFNLLVDLNLVKERACATVSSFIDEGVSKMQNAVYNKVNLMKGNDNRYKRSAGSDESNESNEEFSEEIQSDEDENEDRKKREAEDSPKRGHSKKEKKNGHGKAQEHAKQHAKKSDDDENENRDKREAEHKTKVKHERKHNSHRKKNSTMVQKRQAEDSPKHGHGGQGKQNGHGKALEHANEHAKQHLNKQKEHGKALEHANEHGKQHLGQHAENLVQAKASHNTHQKQNGHGKALEHANEHAKEHLNKQN